MTTSIRTACVLVVVVPSVCMIAATDVLARKWTSTSGQFSVEAEFVKVDGAKVVLKKANGKILTVSLAKLSGADRRYIVSLRAKLPPAPTSAQHKETQRVARSAAGAAEGTNWLVEKPRLKDYEKKSYSMSFGASSFTLSPGQRNSLVVVTFRLASLTADRNAIDVLSASQRLSDEEKKKLTESIKRDHGCFDMAHLRLIDSKGNRYSAIWSLMSCNTEVLTSDGISGSLGNHPEYWSNTKRSAVKISKGMRDKLIKEKAIDENSPDFRTTFSGLLATQHPVEISFLFNLPDSVARNDLRIKYENEQPVAVEVEK